jgi:hypothetical protein
MCSKQVKQFKYLGSIINNYNSIEEEIKERITLGNKAYFANQKFLKSKSVTKQSKLKLYKTVIRPVVIYASETWVLREAMIKKLMIFERKILRRIFGPTKEKDRTWGIKTSEELDYLIKDNIINQIRAQRLSWFGYVQRMSDNRMVKKIYEWKPISTRLQGRPKSRWDDNVKQDICKMKIKNWTVCVQDRGKWRDVVEKARTFNI